MKPLLSWWKKKDEKWETYATSKDTPEAIKDMQEQGFIPMSERIAQIINSNNSKAI